MFNMGMTEMLIIAAIGLVVIGPTKLPGVMRAIGKGLAEFRRASTEFKNTVTHEFEEAAGPEVKELSSMADSLKRKNLSSNLESYLDTAANALEGTENKPEGAETENQREEVEIKPEETEVNPEETEVNPEETENQPEDTDDQVDPSETSSTPDDIPV